MIKLPRVIDGNGNEVKRLHPIAESISEKLVPLSYATLQVMKDEAVEERTYIELYTINGFRGIYRTRAPQKDVVGKTVTLQLEHAISEVGDWLIQDAYDEESTVRNAFVKVFNHYRGTKWQLGTFTASEAVHLEADYDNILETLIGIIQQQPKYYMTFNFGTTPWTVSLAVKPSSISAEGRLSRNIANVIVKRDDKDLCTRVYVKGLPKPAGRTEDENAIGYMDADTQALYGIVEAQTGGSDLTQEQATRVAENYLALHKHPKISAEVEGYDFFNATGETIDKMEVAKKYRLTIPSESVIVEDYITAVNWRDVYNDPESVSVVVGEEQDPVMDFYKAQNSSSKSSRRSSKKQAKINESFDQQFEITDEYGSILNQAGMHLDAYGMIVYARDNVNNIGSIIDQTSSYIITRVDDGDNNLHSEIAQTQSMIHSSVWTANSIIYSYIDQTATYIRQEVGNVESSLRASIQTQADKISLVVEGTGSGSHIKPAAIQAGINAATGQSKITLSADHIILDGNAVANALTVDDAITVASVNAQAAKSYFYDFQFEDPLTGEGPYNSGEILVNAYVDSNNVLHIVNAAGDDTTFSKSIASTPVLTGAWSNGTLTVSSVPAAVSNYVVGISHSTPYVDQSTNKWRMDIQYYGSGTPPTYYNTGAWINLNTYLTTDTITSNGTYTPTGTNKIGFSSVTVNVPSASHSPTASTFTAVASDPGQAFEGRTISQSDGQKWYTYTANCGTSFKNYKLYVDATDYGSARYTAGVNSVTHTPTIAASSTTIPSGATIRWTLQSDTTNQKQYRFTPICNGVEGVTQYMVLSPQPGTPETHSPSVSSLSLGECSMVGTAAGSSAVSGYTSKGNLTTPTTDFYLKIQISAKASCGGSESSTKTYKYYYTVTNK